MARTHRQPVGLDQLFPRVEALRAQVRAMRYTPATDAELEQARKDDAAGVHLNAIEDSHTTPEEFALMAMMIEERLPERLRVEFTDRYIDLLAKSA